MSKTKLTASEWELVRNAPYWVNQALAAADGKVPFFTRRREGKALDKAIKAYQTNNALINDIVADENDAAKEISKASQAEAEQALSRIAAVVAQKLGSNDLNALQDFLMKVGNTVAASSKEGGSGIAKAISEKEAAALVAIEKALKVTATPIAAKPAPSSAKPAPAPAKPSSSAQPLPAPAPAKPDDDAKAKEEAARKQAEARERLENAHKEAMAKAEAKEKAEAEAREREAKEKAEADAAKAREEAARKEAEAKAAASAPRYTEFIAEHTVVAGDNLSFISQRYYGHQGNFRIIYEANKDVIGDNMNLIRPGQVLKIPKL